MQDEEDYIEGDIEVLEEKRIEEEVNDKAEELAQNTNIDMEEQSFTKVKQNKQAKKTETVKKDFLKERKKMYKKTSK